MLFKKFYTGLMPGLIGSGWIIESIESQYINFSAYRPIAGNSYIDLPIELRNPKKGLIMIRNIFHGIMLDILILPKNIQKKIKELIERLLVILIMTGLNFL